MLNNLTTVAVSLLGAVTTSVATLPTPSYASQPTLNQILDQVAMLNQAPTQETATKEVVPETPKPKVKRLICKDCNTYEARVLEFLQDKGVTDRNALATIMGNIRQESTFIPNICEGGARTSYRGCTSGGYGILQWTDSARYNGLGHHAGKLGSSPSSLETQLDYLINESDWKMIEGQMKTPGKTINDYMRLARKWIRWGHHGARTDYAYDYASKLVMVEVEKS